MQAIWALTSADWITVELRHGPLTAARANGSRLEDWRGLGMGEFVHVLPCRSIGSRHFWLPARFSSYISLQGTHQVYSFGRNGGWKPH